MQIPFQKVCITAKKPDACAIAFPRGLPELAGTDCQATIGQPRLVSHDCQATTRPFAAIMLRHTTAPKLLNFPYLHP
jgi:hypothetical protein